MTTPYCERHQECSDMVKDHEKRIVLLEQADATFIEKMGELLRRLDRISQRLDDLISTWNKVLIGALSVMTMFFIWYVQKGG